MNLMSKEAIKQGKVGKWSYWHGAQLVTLEAQTATLKGQMASEGAHLAFRVVLSLSLYFGFIF